jgi:FkbM family methyltransferase
MITSFNNDPKWMYIIHNDVKRSYSVPNGLKTCLDIGMNIGSFGLWHFRKFDRIWGFEPAYDTFHTATRLFNTFGIDNVTAYQLAVTGKSGEVLTLHQPKKHMRSGNARLNPIGRAVNETETVYSIGINDVFKLIGEDEIDYLKMDIEGAEELILPSVDLRKFKWIGIELHGWIDVERCLKYMEDAGFTYKHGKPGTAEGPRTWRRRE